MKINKINIFTTIFTLVILTGTIFAIDDKYEPGETLNPSCTPGEANCTVEYKGKFVDGSDVNNAIYTIGNVGINTINPNYKLDVNGNTHIASKLNIGNIKSSNWALMITNEGQTYGTGFFVGSNGEIDFRTRDTSNTLTNLISASGSSYFNAGNVGIGTAGPTYKLDVAGDINYTGDLYKNGVLVSGGGGASAINDLSDAISNSGDSSIFLGSGAGVNDDGSNNSNTAVGINSLNSNTTGSRNTAVGYYALDSNTTGYSNTAYGNYALHSNTTGIDNTAVGDLALYWNTDGYSNTAYGKDALRNNTSGTSNTAIGALTLHENTTGSDNVANGKDALYFNTTGAGNVANGYYSLRHNTTASYNTATGWSSMFDNTTGHNNTAYGVESLKSNTEGNDNVAIGSWAVHNNTTGSSNVAIGPAALLSNTTGWRNMALGGWSLFNNTTGTNNIAIGEGAIYSGNANDNVAIGNWSMNQNTDGYGNVAIGPWSMNQNNSGHENVAVGKSTLWANKTGNSNVAMGDWAAHKNIDGNSNIAIGVASLYANEHGSDNTSVGVAALNRTEDGTGNTAMGLAALYWNKNGDDNIAIGVRAGERSADDSTNEDTNKDIFIGTNTRSGDRNSENETIIGYGAIGNGSNTVTIGNSNIIGNYLRQSVEINSPDGSTASLFLSEGNHYGFRFDYNGSSDRLDLWSRKFSGNQAIRTTWLKNGNVGIGTTSPQGKLDVNGDIYTKGIKLNDWGFKDSATDWLDDYKNEWGNGGGGNGGAIDCTSLDYGCEILADGIYEVSCYQRGNSNAEANNPYIGISLNGDRSALESRSNAMWTHDHTKSRDNFAQSHYIGSLSDGEIVSCGAPSAHQDNMTFSTSGWSGALKIKRVQ